MRARFWVICASLMLGCATAHAIPRAGKGVDAGLTWGFGSAGGGVGSPAGRAVSVLAMHAFPHFEFDVRAFSEQAWIRPGVLGEYRFVTQLSDPASAGGRDLRGDGMLAGIGVEGAMRKYSLSIGYSFLGKHTTGPIDPGGAQLVYTVPSSIRIAVSYRPIPMFDFVLDYRHSSFNRVSAGGQPYIDLPDSPEHRPLVYHSVGLGTRIVF